jgi:hypothetical protein
MAFLNPIMLLGISAVSVPILIHLLNRRKFERIVWAAMRFLRVSVEQNQRRMRIEDLVLLALRCLLLVLLALALARPAIRAASAGEVFGRAKVTAVIAIDNSYSMCATDGVSSRLDKAKKAAEEVLNTIPAGSSCAVLLASDVVRGVIPEPTFDLNLARKAIREVKLSDRGTNVFPAVREALDILARKSSLRKEAYLITDGQLEGWKQIEDVRRAIDAAKREARVHVVFVDAKEDRNLGISDLRVGSGLTPANRPLRFEVQVTNYGTAEARDVRVSLRVDGEPPSDEAVIDSIPAGASKSISLFAKLRTPDYHTATASITPDRLPADDSRTVAVRGVAEVKVLLVDGDPGREPRESEVFFLRNALVPVPPTEAEGFFIKAETVPATDLESAKLDRYDAVFLCNVTDFSTTVVDALESYLRRGGGVVIFPGQNTRENLYNEELLNGRSILPAALGEPRGQADRDEKFMTFADRNLEHPIAAIWKDAASGSLSSAHFFRYFPLAPAAQDAAATRPAEAGEPRVVLRYADGTPAVMERAWGAGRVVLFSSTADTAWNDLPAHPGLFVPLVYRTLGAIVQRQDEGLNLRVGDKFSYRLPTDLLGREAVVAGPGEKEGPRESRRIEMVGGAPVLQYDETGLGGPYEVTIAGETPTVIRFATQPNPAESSLAQVTPEQIGVLSNVAHVVNWTPGVSLEGAIEKERVGTELWLTLAVMGLCVAATETVLAHVFSRSK